MARAALHIFEAHSLSAHDAGACCMCGAGGSLKPFGVPKAWDLFYSNQGGDWNDFARNWTLAKACFKRLITELGVKASVLSMPVPASMHPLCCGTPCSSESVTCIAVGVLHQATSQLSLCPGASA